MPESTQIKPLERLQKAMTALLQPPTRDQRGEIQKLLHSWDVPQKNNGKRSFDEVKAELLAKVIEETHRLQRMQGAPETSSPHADANAAGWRFSAITASFQNAYAQRFFPDSLGPNLQNVDKRAVPHERGEEQPKKRS